MQAYSLDLRARVVRAYEQGGVTLAEIAVQFSVGQTFVKKMLRQKRETGSLERLPQRAGAKKKLSDAQRKWVALQVKAVPDVTLGELQEQLGAEKHVQVSQATVCRELQALRLPRKKSQ
jgi:transposase